MFRKRFGPWSAGRSLLVATLSIVAQSLVIAAGQRVTRIEVGNVEVVEPVRYDADRDQAQLTRPDRWCAPPRAQEPLLAEVAALLSSAEQAEGFRTMNDLPGDALGDARVIRDEGVCEAAAKAYDRVEYQGTDEPHTSIRAVLVVSAGTVYFVDDLRGRDEVWLVVPFDRSWKTLAMPYGAGH